MASNNPFGTAAPSTFSSIAQGITQGIRTGQKQRERRQQRELQQRLRDIQEKRLEFRRQKFQAKQQQKQVERAQTQRFNQALQSIVAGNTGAATAQAGGAQQPQTLADLPRGVPTDEVTPGSVQQEQSIQQQLNRSQGLQMVSTIADLGKLPKSARGPQVDTFAAQFQKETGKKIAPNVVETLKKGSSEDLSTISRGVAKLTTENEDVGAQEIAQVLSDPAASAQVLTEAGKLGQRLQEQQELTEQAGGQPQQATGAAQGARTQQTGQAQGGQTGTQTATQPPQQGAQAQADPSGPLRQAQAIDRRLQKLEQLKLQAPNEEARQKVESARSALERQRERAIGQAQSRVLQQVQDAPRDEKIEALRQLEQQMLQVGAKQGRIESVRSRISDLEAEQQGLELTNDFQRKAFELFGQQVVSNGEFDASKLAPEQVGQINRELGSNQDSGSTVSFSSDFRETAMGMFSSDKVTNENGEFDPTKLSSQEIEAVNQRMQNRKIEQQQAEQEAKERFRLLREVNKQAAKAATTAQFLQRVKETPREAFGLRGVLTGMSEATLGQFFPGASDAVERVLSGGATEQDRRRVRVVGRKALTQAIEAVTGEGSSRISESERQLTERELPNINKAFNTKEATQSAFQSIGALQTLAAEKSHILARGKPTFDPNDPAEVANKVNLYMERFGMSREEAKDLYRDVVRLNKTLESPVE